MRARTFSRAARRAAARRLPATICRRSTTGGSSATSSSTAVRPGSIRIRSGRKRRRRRTFPAGRSASSSGRAARCLGSSSGGTSCSCSCMRSRGSSRAPGCVSSDCRAVRHSQGGWHSRSRLTASSRVWATCSARSPCCCRWRCGRSSARGAEAGGGRFSPLRRSRRSHSPVRCTSPWVRSRSSSPTRSSARRGAGRRRSRASRQLSAPASSSGRR